MDGFDARWGRGPVSARQEELAEEEWELVDDDDDYFELTRDLEDLVRYLVHIPQPSEG